ncbi:MAG TPA: DUF1775 domain-containing protein [Gaiellaceae bacterium]|nr:DUF1775 domain-containing protein [Gaiellaceae bacterium]
MSLRYPKGLSMKKLIAAAAAVVVAGVYAPFAGAHATVNLLLGQPTAASTATWFLRVPNERANKSTFKVTMSVPAAIQQSITVRQAPGWKVTFTRVDTGQKDGEGNPIYNTTQVTWQSLPGNLIRPGMYGSFEFRFKAPSTAQQLCFPVDQVYNGAVKGMAAETVSWSGPPTSATPASCVNITA